MNKGIALVMLVLVAMAYMMTGCKSWSPSKEPGKCAIDRQWVEPKQDPDTGEWKDGYCECVPGKVC